MIITVPTALYLSVLPKSANDPTAITWLISSTDPPRTISDTPLLTKQEESQKLPAILFDPIQRQTNVGEFVFNVNYSIASKIGSGIKSFEVGQILEFETSGDEIDIESLRVPEVVDLQQNTNILDLLGAGLSEQEVKEFENQSREMFNTLISEINTNKANINSLEVSIGDNQKTINETKKIRQAVELINNKILLDKLVAKENVLIDEKARLLNHLNDLNLATNNLYDRLLLIKEIVR